jgi:DNA polymerase-4
VRSISAETTFETDLAELDPLRGHLWRLAVRVADRAKAKGLAGGTVTLKLKTAGFRTLTRQTALPEPTQLAEGFHPAAALLLTQAQAQGPFRLIGIGLSQLGPAPAEDVSGLFADAAQTRARAERATDQIRARFGAETIFRGRSLR